MQPQYEFEYMRTSSTVVYIYGTAVSLRETMKHFLYSTLVVRC
jgi:hypothetical protein